MAPKPSAFKAHIEVNGDVQAADALRSIGKRAKNTRPLMEVAVGMLAQQQKRRFDQKPWAPLAAGTVARKEYEAENPEIFRDEARFIKGSPTRVPDELFRAVTVPGHPGQLRYVTRASATFGVQSAGKGPLFYARFVQNVKGKQRRILAISDADALALLKLCASYIYDGWPRSGGMTRPGTSPGLAALSGLGFAPTGGGLYE